MTIIKDIPGHSRPVDRTIESKRVVDQRSAIKMSGGTTSRSLASYVSGSKVVVDEYYKQYLLEDDLPRDYDNNASGVVQQYQLLKNLEIKLTNISKSTQNTKNGIFGGTQTAVIPSGIRPYTGDVMIMSTLDKKRIMYRVSRVERLTIIDESAYQIEFEYMTIFDKDDEAGLRNKTVHVAEYSKYRLQNGGDAVINGYVFEELTSLELKLRPLISKYIDDFLDRRSGTLILDMDGERIYDPILVRFFLHFADLDFDRRIKDICHYGGHDWVSKAWSESIYEALYVRSLFNLKHMSKAIETNDGGAPSKFGGNKDIFYQDISKVAFPISSDEAAEDYVVSSNILDRGEGLFENSCFNYINRSSISTEDINTLIKEISDMDDSSRYYKVPVLMMFIKAQLIEDS